MLVEVRLRLSPLASLHLTNHLAAVAGWGHWVVSGKVRRQRLQGSRRKVLARTGY